MARWCAASSMWPTRMASLRRLVLLPVRAFSSRARSVAALLCALLSHRLHMAARRTSWRSGFMVQG